MRVVFQNWKSFYTSIKDYKKNPSKYLGKPKIPKYSRSSTKEVIFSNQDCKIKEVKYLKLPLTKTRLNIGKLGKANGVLKQVRVIPKHFLFVLELVLEVQPSIEAKVDSQRYMGIDLGNDNLATITSNTGMTSVLFKGKHIKAINQYFNKLRAYYLGILRHGKEPKEGPHTSKRLEKLYQTRLNKIKDLFHKVSFHIVKLAIHEDIHTIMVGKNQGWKQQSNMGKRNNQTFCTIPHAMLIEMITYKAKEKGISVIVTEESYTSKASFLDLDELPVHEKGKKYSFSGRRVHRGLYKSHKGLINADVNGSYNIIRKVCPDAFAKRVNESFTATPIAICVQ